MTNLNQILTVFRETMVHNIKITFSVALFKTFIYIVNIVTKDISEINKKESQNSQKWHCLGKRNRGN